MKTLKSPKHNPTPIKTLSHSAILLQCSRLLHPPSNSSPMAASSEEPVSHSTSSHLTRNELLLRRLARTRKLSRIYRRHFWTFMDCLRAQHRLYYWKYGLDPYVTDDRLEINNFSSVDNAAAVDNYNGDGDGNCGVGKLGLGFGEGAHRCGYNACKLKAMALTSFCHLHILSDPNQKLYKPCNFVIKAPEQGQILCGKPILSSTVPSLCSVHLPKTLKDVKQALKKAGLAASSSGRLAPKFHVVLAEYVKLIQSKRRAAPKRNKNIILITDESSS